MPDSHLSDATQPIDRRRAIGVIGATGLALLGSTLPSSAFLFGGSRQTAQLNHSRLSADWVARQGSNLQAYANYLAGLNLKHVSPQQVIEAHAKRRGSVWNSLPPEKLWKNMAPTLKAVDRVAGELGRDVREIVSAYRSPAYNRRCPGASRQSWHMSNVAVDVKFSVRPSTVSSVARNLRKRGVFSGGVGRYYGFTHIDTRGYNADW